MKNSEEEDFSFETGLEKLEAIVDEMENGELPLDDLIKRYEEGTKLLARCDAKIKQAEKKIQVLKNRDLENPEFENFDPDSAE